MTVLNSHISKNIILAGHAPLEVVTYLTYFVILWEINAGVKYWSRIRLHKLDFQQLRAGKDRVTLFLQHMRADLLILDVIMQGVNIH